MLYWVPFCVFLSFLLLVSGLFLSFWPFVFSGKYLVRTGLWSVHTKYFPEKIQGPPKTIACKYLLTFIFWAGTQKPPEETPKLQKVQESSLISQRGRGDRTTHSYPTIPKGGLYPIGVFPILAKDLRQTITFGCYLPSSVQPIAYAWPSSQPDFVGPRTP